MKKIIAHLYSLILVGLAVYLLYSKTYGVINYDYIWSLDTVFLLILLVIILFLIVVIQTSTADKKKRYIIGWCVLLLFFADIWLRDTSQFFGSDITKWVSVIWIFLALFGILSKKKEIIKGEYTKKSRDYWGITFRIYIYLILQAFSL